MSCVEAVAAHRVAQCCVAFSVEPGRLILWRALANPLISIGLHDPMNQRTSAIPVTRDIRANLVAHDSGRNSIGRIGSQPILLAGAVLLAIMAGVASIALWRTYSGAWPETDRVAAARALQTRSVQASEQLVEKAKGLEITQQESIDQLQVVQDQLSTVRHLLSTQQAETKRLSDQVTTLAEAIDGLRQSFASAQPSEAASPPVRNKAARVRATHPVNAASQPKRPKTHG
jgi:uncharacterized protein HemX